MKIPSLVAPELPEGVFDSRVICDYLETLHGAKSPFLENDVVMKTLHALVDGITDAGASTCCPVEERAHQVCQAF
jgi:glutathione S-transferase